MNEADAAVCRGIRQTIYETAMRGGAAHLASAFSSVELIYALYGRGLVSEKKGDRFILSKGHAALALYAVLAETGRLTRELLDKYLRPDGLGGEPNMLDSPAIEATTGSLGHGLSMGVGIALASRMDGGDGYIYVLLGDGECQEGSVWEAAMAASAHRLGHLIAILDKNGLQKGDTVEHTMGDPRWEEKWSACGFGVTRVDGHDTDAIYEAVNTVTADAPVTGSPHIIIADTVKGRGVSLMEGDAAWHYRLPRKKEQAVFERELGLSRE